MLKFKCQNPKHGGFTLIEIITVVGVVLIIIVTAIPAYRNFQKQSDLINTTEEIMNVLRSAQSKTLASEQASRWGIHFLASEYILFKGVDYDSRNSSFDKNYIIPNSVEIYEINLEGAGLDVVFERITGQTNQFGNISLRLKTNISETRIIIVELSGQIVSQQTVPSDTERIKDSRHTHFNYARQINTSIEILTLTFTYDSSSFSEDIMLINNIKDNQIFWEDEVSVNGEIQKIKIHTHNLNDPIFNTDFSVHRDKRYNNKALKIEISGDSTGDLINYDSAGQTIQGSSIYVSEPIWQ